MWVGKPSGRLTTVTAVAFAPDGRTIYTGDSEGWVLAWDVTTHEKRALFRQAKRKPGSRVVYTLWPTPNGKRLLVSNNQSLRDAFQPKAPPLITVPQVMGDAMSYLLPDGKRVITCDPEWRVGLWNLETGKRLPVPGELGRVKEITYHELLPDGVTLLTYKGSKQLILWDFRTGERVGKLTPSAFGINPCALAKDGSTFVVGRDNTLWVYDVPSRKLRQKLEAKTEFEELAFHPNGRLVASASNDDLTITLWDVAAGKLLTQFDWDAGRILALAFSPDGLTCAVAAGSLIVFDVDL